MLRFVLACLLLAGCSKAREAKQPIAMPGEFLRGSITYTEDAYIIKVSIVPASDVLGPYYQREGNRREAKECAIEFLAADLGCTKMEIRGMQVVAVENTAHTYTATYRVPINGVRVIH